MTSVFDVLDQPWIPVVRRDGSNGLMGIREVLRLAQELSEVSCASPLEVQRISVPGTVPDGCLPTRDRG